MNYQNEKLRGNIEDAEKVSEYIESKLSLNLSKEVLDLAKMIIWSPGGWQTIGIIQAINSMKKRGSIALEEQLALLELLRDIDDWRMFALEKLDKKEKTCSQ